MSTTGISEASSFENRFWLQILGDHARFIFYSLAATETEQLQKAQQFIGIFDRLLEKARQGLSDAETESLNKTAYENAGNLRDFKLRLLTLSLHSQLRIHLSPTFFDHMLNELEEYLLVLNALINHQETLYHPLHYHLLWLSDALGHAASVSATLDEVEKDYIKTSMDYEQKFNELYIKSINFKGYLRTGLTDFPALRRLSAQSASLMFDFKDFLEDIKAQRLDARLLGTLMPLMADHMAREECYYLTKLSLSAGTENPDCDPARPRIEG